MFFDGKHLRVREFISPASIIYHPLLKSQIMLGTMDCKHEDTNYVKRFWRIFNSAYKEANWTIEKFNSAGWCSDMADANFNRLKKIYGEDEVKCLKGKRLRVSL